MRLNHTVVPVNGCAKVLVADIPESYPGADIKPTRDCIRKVVELIPDPDSVPARFEDDLWDFQNCFRYARGWDMVLDFSDCPEGSKNIMKLFALDCMEKGLKINTIKNKCNMVKKVLSEAMREAIAGRFEYITEEQIYPSIEGKDASASNCSASYSAVMAFYRSANRHGLKHHVSLTGLEHRKNYYGGLVRFGVPNSAPTIPADYYKILTETFDRVMRDENEPLNMRLTAGIMLIESQLGLRDSEVSLLPKNCLRQHLTPSGTYKPYIVYRSLKAARGRAETVEVETICTPLLLRTLEYYLDLRKRCVHADEEFMYVLDAFSTYPLDHSALRERYYQLIRTYVPEARRPHGKLRPYEFRGDVLYFPRVQSFRVYFAQYLADIGMPRPFIEKVMSHKPGSNCDDSYYGHISVPRGPQLEGLFSLPMDFNE